MSRKARRLPLRVRQRNGRHLLDPLRAASYIAAGLWMTACGGRAAPLIPEPLAAAPPESVTVWTGGIGPTGPVALRFKWRYRDQRVSGGGRGTARVAPPDSVRVDWATSFNIKTGAAVVVGDSLRWADPEDQFSSSVAQALQLVWTALGVVRPPLGGAVVSGARDSARVLWRHAESRDTVDYRLVTAAPRTLEAEWRREGRVMARSRTVLGPAGLPQSVRIDVPERPARFELTFVAVDTTATFAPALWRSRR